MARKHNPADSTGRNVRASRGRDDQLLTSLKKLERQTAVQFEAVWKALTRLKRYLAVPKT